MIEAVPFVLLLLVEGGALVLTARRSRQWPRLRRAARAAWTIWRGAPAVLVQAVLVPAPDKEDAAE